VSSATALLTTSVSLHDIEDVERFVANSLHRSGLPFKPQEQEELISEGICILYELAERYEPKRVGYAQAGRFSGYAAQFLPRRLGDAWHKRHPEHRRIAGEDGKRRWVYTEPALSFDEIISLGPRRNPEGGSVTVETSIRPPSQWAPVTICATSPTGSDR
jgi:hypothetical protein